MMRAEILSGDLLEFKNDPRVETTILRGRTWRVLCLTSTQPVKHTVLVLERAPNADEGGRAEILLQEVTHLLLVRASPVVWTQTRGVHD